MTKHVARYKPNKHWTRRLADTAWENRGAIVKTARTVGSKIAKSYRPSKRSKPSSANRSSKKMKTAAEMIHSGADITGTTITLHKKIALGKTQKSAGTWKYVQNHQSKLISTAGIQSANVVGAGSTISQCLNSTGAAYDYYHACIAYEQMNPNLTNTGSSIFSSIVTPLNDRFIIESQLVEFDLSNLSGVSTYCELYICTNRCASTSDPVTDWAAGYLDDAFVKTAFVAPTAGLTGTGTYGAGTAGYVGATPGESSRFRSQWRIRHRHRFQLAGAASYQHSVKINVNKLIKRESINNTAGYYVVGTSWVAFLVQRGAVVLDNTAAAHLPTFGATEIGIVTTVKTRLSAVAGQASRLPATLMADTIPSGATLANQGIINEVDVDTNVGTMTV